MTNRTIEDTTFCTGLWHLKKNTKKNFEKYLEILPQTLKLIEGGNLIIASDTDAIFSIFEREAKKFSVRVQRQLMDINQLPFYADSAALLRCCQNMGRYNWLTLFRVKDRGRKLYRREYGLGGAENYRAIISLWMSKTPLVQKFAIDQNPFGTTYSAWMDTSVSRFNGRRENWNFSEQSFGHGKFYHYGTKSWYKGQKMKINCSFMLAQNDTWPKVTNLFEECLRQSLNENYAHDDETIFNRVVKAHPELFEVIGQIIQTRE
jgi:hypothetical protein